MGAHTPGPWKAADPGDYGDYNGECIVVLGDHKRVAVVLGYGPESQADARLIASAPELLEALSLLLHEVDESAIAGAHDYGWPVAVQKSRAAIAKATGGHR